MRYFLFPSMAVAMLVLVAGSPDRTMAQQTKPIRIGVNTAIQAQVGRDAIDSVKMAIDEINAQGGLLGRKFEMIVADEGEVIAFQKSVDQGDNPDLGIAITGNPSVVSPHCRVATHFRHDQIERRQVVLTY